MSDMFIVVFLHLHEGSFLIALHHIDVGSIAQNICVKMKFLLASALGNK